RLLRFGRRRRPAAAAHVARRLDLWSEKLALAHAAIRNCLDDDVDGVRRWRLRHVAKAVGLDAQVHAADDRVDDAAERRQRQAGQRQFSEFASRVHEALVATLKGSRYLVPASSRP